MINPSESRPPAAPEPTSIIRTGESGRVFLRPLSAADEDEFISLVKVSGDLHGSWARFPDAPQAFQEYVVRYSGLNEESLLVCLRDGGAIAGLVNLNSIIRGRFQNASLAYAAFAPTAGRGYLTEGVALVVHHAFAELRLHRLDAQIQPSNKASLALIQRLGFSYEGLSPDLLYIDGAWRDHERWALTNAGAGVTPPPHPTLPEH